MLILLLNDLAYSLGMFCPQMLKYKKVHYKT